MAPLMLVALASARPWRKCRVASGGSLPRIRGACAFDAPGPSPAGVPMRSSPSGDLSGRSGRLNARVPAKTLCIDDGR